MVATLAAVAIAVSGKREVIGSACEAFLLGRGSGQAARQQHYMKAGFRGFAESTMAVDIGRD